MARFWTVVKRVIKESDIILLVLDARFPELSRNEELEVKANEKKIPIIFVLNKCDLVDKRRMDKVRRSLKNCVFVSARDHLGTTLLKKKILEVSQGKRVTVGVVGYPNTGKSSLINTLRGKKGAKTSAQSGFTKGKQILKVSEKIFLIDTPGVLPYLEDDASKLAIIGAIDHTKIKDPDIVFAKLVQDFGDLICSYYKVELKEDYEDILEAMAIKFGKLKKGGIPDVTAVAKMVIMDWQRGKIKVHP
jgi:ribosome biogenesis GTPase A